MNQTVAALAAALKGQGQEKGNKKEQEDDDCRSDDCTATEDDDPRQSAAALCISMRFLGSLANDEDDNEEQQITTYGPEFTHQCFDGEFIPGYEPFEQDMNYRMSQIQKLKDDETPDAAQHSSHENLDTAEEYLRIKVDIAPSCAACKLTFETEAKQKTGEENRAAKRRRVDSDPDHDQKYAGNESKGNSEKEKEAAKTPKPKMPLSQVLDCLRSMLPDIVEEDVSNNFLNDPFGLVLHEYSKGDANFCVSLANGIETPGLAEYHHSVQRLALGWIEAADGIDVTYQPHGGQYWQIVYLFQKHADHKYSLAGYMTLWTVTSLLAKPVPGRVLRITQALILPHHQRSGHGHEIMRVIYKMAQGDYDEILPKPSKNPEIVEPIVQVNVEDPAPGFTALRDLVDYTMVLERLDWAFLLRPKALLACASDSNTQEADETAPSTKQSLFHEISVQAKITPRQVQIVHEIFMLNASRQADAVSDAASSAYEEKRFRLEVKARLYQENKQSIVSLPSKDAMRAELHKLYEEQKAHYERIWKKCHGCY